MRNTIITIFSGLGRIFLLVWLLSGAVECVAAQDPVTFTQEWALISEEDANKLALPADIGNTFFILWLQPQSGYHFYSNEPGPGIRPTEVTVASAVNWQIQYPHGVIKPDIFEPDKNVEIYEKNTPIFIFFSEEIPLSSEITVSLLACSDYNCVPFSKTMVLSQIPSDLHLAETQPWYNQLLSSKPSAAITAVPILPLSDDSLLQPLDLPTTSIFANMEQQEWDFTPIPFQAVLEVTGLLKAIIFGLIAGLLLNIMPCVLPVITLKISTLLAAQGESDKKLHTFREHNLLFSIGIFTWFAILALLFGLAGLAWGQMFQNSAVIYAMVLIVFCLALSMFDIFFLPVLGLKPSQGANAKSQAFTTGLLATMLATPCSGPLLGGVLGWSLMQSLPVLLVVFLSTGVGMATPYLIMACKPQFANLLPKPGGWMLVFERIVGFFLMGTALYLLSLLPGNMLIPALFSLLVAAFVAWFWGKWGSFHNSGIKKILIGAFGLILISASIFVVFAPQKQPLWQDYERSEFSALLGEVPLLVEFTADWCPTCKLLEHSTLSDANLTPLVNNYNLTLIRVDMTRDDEDKWELLRSLDSASIPVLAVFPVGPDSHQPVVLRDLYSSKQLQGAIVQALH